MNLDAWPATAVGGLWLLDFARYVVSDLAVCAAELRERWRARHPESTTSVVERSPAPGSAETWSSPDLPLVSAIVVGHNEAGTFPQTVASLLEQTWPTLEIIVVDDGSTDGTPAVMRDFIRRLEASGDTGPSGRPARRCRFFSFHRRNGKAAALNLGTLVSRGSILVYVDADSSYAPDAIEEIVRPLLLEPRIGAVAGNLGVANANRSLLTRLVDMEYLFSIGIGRRFRSMVGMLHVISGAFGAFRRPLVEAVGGHRSTSGNDGDLTMKIRRVAPRICFAHRARCLTNTPATLKKLVRQRRRWDRNTIKNKGRRHVDLLDLRSNAFDWRNALVVIDSLLFHMVLGMRWAVAFVALLLLEPEAAPAALAATWCVYLCGGALQLILAHWLYPPDAATRRERWLALPLFPIYKAFFRLVRLYACIEEVAGQASSSDGFAPDHVAREVHRFEHLNRCRMRRLIQAFIWPFGSAEASQSPLT